MAAVVGIGIAQAELQVISYCLRDLSRLQEVEDHLLFTTPAQEILKGIKRLHGADATITSQTLAAELDLAGGKKFTDQALSGLWLRSVTERDYSYWRQKLIEARDKEDLHETVVKELIAKSLDKTSLDLDDIAGLHEKLSAFLQRAGGVPNAVITAPQLADNFEQTLRNRVLTGFQYSTGCSFLDARLNDGFAAGTQTVLFGATGSGKTNYALALTMRQMHKNIPSVYISLEMSQEQLSDRLFAMKTGIPYAQLQPHLNDGVISEEVFHRLVLFKKQLYNRPLFRLVDCNSLTLAELEYYIQTIKLQMGVNYLCVTIDLTSMIKEFYIPSKGLSKPDQIESSMNELNRIAKKHNVHILSVVQSNREQDNVKITKLEDIEKCRPTLASVKSSSSYAERCRVLLGIHRTRYYIDKYLPERKDEVPSTIEIDILKQSQGEGSRLKYYFAGDTAQIFMQATTGTEPVAKKGSDENAVY